MTQSPAASHIRDVNQAIDICEPNVRGMCGLGDRCPLHHYPMPYLWQIRLEDQGWQSLQQESQAIEEAYCSPGCHLYNTQCAANLPDGTAVPMNLTIDFDTMKVKMTSHHGLVPPQGLVTDIRRLSTPSYLCGSSGDGGSEREVRTQRHWTHWRWLWYTGNDWKLFNQDGKTPMQHVLEAKFLHGQGVFRFEIETTPRPGAEKKQEAYLLDMRSLKLIGLNDQGKWNVSRRPLIVTQQDITSGKFIPCPDMPTSPFLNNIPDNWEPIDPQQEFELVPLNPDSMEFHLIASEFQRSVLDRVIKDIFRIQNPFLWHRYHSKRMYMQQKHKDPNEMQLFHGTNSEVTVQSIFKQNFDWRVCGKNNTLFGRGAYFARDASFSDKYTSKTQATRWMFMARVLVGRSVKGKPEFVRPPPVDPALPHGDLFDSCVDNESHPAIYVLFDIDQCYPEFVISYQLKSGAS